MRLAAQMSTQSIGDRCSRRANQHTNVGHAFATLLAEEVTVALYKVNEETLDLVLEIGRHQIDAIPGHKID